VRVHCNECGAETDAAPNRLLCGSCGAWQTRLISGDEMLLANLELRIPDPPNLHAKPGPPDPGRAL